MLSAQTGFISDERVVWCRCIFVGPIGYRPIFVVVVSVVVAVEAGLFGLALSCFCFDLFLLTLTFIVTGPFSLSHSMTIFIISSC